MQQLAETRLELVWQCVEAAYATIGPALHIVAQLVVFARQDYLEEVLVVHLPVAVRIEKAEEFCAVVNSHAEGSIVFEENHNVVGAHFFVGLAVDAAEGGVGGEQGLAAEGLAVSLDDDLGLGDGVEHLLEEEL
jgi:hypothetical protein